MSNIDDSEGPSRSDDETSQNTSGKRRSAKTSQGHSSSASNAANSGSASNAANLSQHTPLPTGTWSIPAHDKGKGENPLKNWADLGPPNPDDVMQRPTHFITPFPLSAAKGKTPEEQSQMIREYTQG